MTDKPRAPRNSAPLTAEDVVKDARKRNATLSSRIHARRDSAEAEERADDLKRLVDRFARVPRIDRDVCRGMLRAAGIHALDGLDAETDELTYSTPPSEPDAVAERLREPLSPQRLAVGKK